MAGLLGDEGTPAGLPNEAGGALGTAERLGAGAGVGVTVRAGGAMGTADEREGIVPGAVTWLRLGAKFGFPTDGTAERVGAPGATPEGAGFRPGVPGVGVGEPGLRFGTAGAGLETPGLRVGALGVGRTEGVASAREGAEAGPRVGGSARVGAAGVGERGAAVAGAVRLGMFRFGTSARTAGLPAGAVAAGWRAGGVTEVRSGAKRVPATVGASPRVRTGRYGASLGRAELALRSAGTAGR